MSSLGFQLVYGQLGEMEDVVCERFFLPGSNESLRSLESDRPLSSFSLIFFSVSFEHDYLNLVRLILAASLPLYSKHRTEEIAPAQPLIVCGGVASFMNPEPLAPFIDLFLLGEAEQLLGPFLALFKSGRKQKRHSFLRKVVETMEGAYVPSFYQPEYDAQGRFAGYSHETFAPARVKKCILAESSTAAHSQLLTSEAEFSDLYLTELGRGCSRGCRFCAAGFIYRPPRLWGSEAVLTALSERHQDVSRIGLLGMEMASEDSLDKVSKVLLESGCALSFSSLRADRISGSLLTLLSASNLKSVAIAPDGASERLRRVINKGLTSNDLISAAEQLVQAGLYRLKLYLMIGLPSETYDDLEEIVDLIRQIKVRIMEIGRKRGRLCEISLSVNSFTPKPWTPFQFHPFGISERLVSGKQKKGKDAVRGLEEKIKFLKMKLKQESNVKFSFDKPGKVLFQAVLSRGDRRLAPVLEDMATQRLTWKRAMKKKQLCPEQFAVCGYDQHDTFPWDIVDHGITVEYLFSEYEKAFAEKTTVPCDTRVCKRCGVCS